MLASFGEILELIGRREVCLPALDIGGGQPDFVEGILRACEAARPAHGKTIPRFGSPSPLYPHLTAMFAKNMFACFILNR